MPSMVTIQPWSFELSIFHTKQFGKHQVNDQNPNYDSFGTCIFQIFFLTWIYALHLQLGQLIGVQKHFSCTKCTNEEQHLDQPHPDDTELSLYQLKSNLGGVNLIGSVKFFTYQEENKYLVTWLQKALKTKSVVKVFYRQGAQCLGITRWSFLCGVL